MKCTYGAGTPKECNSTEDVADVIFEEPGTRVLDGQAVEPQHAYLCKFHRTELLLMMHKAPDFPTLERMGRRIVEENRRARTV